MTALTLQPGIGDRDDLFVQLQRTPPTTGLSAYTPVLHGGTYFLTDPGEYYLFGAPSPLQGPATVTGGAVTQLALTGQPLPDLSYAPSATVLWAPETAPQRLTPMTALAQHEDVTVERYAIARPVTTVTGATLTCTSFPTGTAVGFSCWNAATPATAYTITALTATTLTLNSVPVGATAALWYFEVRAARLLYPFGSPLLSAVVANYYNQTAAPVVLTAGTDYYYDTSSWLILPATLVLGQSCDVQYYADNSCAWDHDSMGNPILSVYTSAGVTGSALTGVGLTFCYQCAAGTVLRSLDTVNLNPLVTGASEGFLYITNQVTTPSQVTFDASPSGGILPIVSTTGPRFGTLALVARLLDGLGNPISNQAVTWSYQKNAGAWTALATDTETVAGTVTAADGTVGASIGNTFLRTTAGLGLTDTLHFCVNIAGAPATGTVATSSTGPYTPTSVNQHTASSYLHLVQALAYQDDTGSYYNLCVWEETLLSGAWQRRGATGTIALYTVAPDGTISAATTATGLATGTAPTPFPCAITFTNVPLTSGMRLYALRTTATGAQLQSNLVMI